MTMAHQNCSCSKHRPCAFHKAQAKKMARVAQAARDRQRVQMGIEQLRALYGRDVRR
jgi:hypothetical protein